MNNKKRTIITVALTGSKGNKKSNPNTPITCDEIIEDAYQCYRHGASIAHIHIKADDGITPEINYNKFQYIKEGIQNKCDMIINFTTSGETNYISGLKIIGTIDDCQEKRLGILESKPEIATYDIPTMNFGDYIFINPLTFLRQLGLKMKKKSILPEVEIYNLGDVAIAEQLITEGVLNSNAFFQLCLGIRGGIPATVKNLVLLQETLPKDINWSAFGVGVNHLSILYSTIALGGHVRVGLEDNLYYSKGQLTTNVELVKRATRLIKEFGNEVAKPSEARKILGL